MNAVPKWPRRALPDSYLRWVFSFTVSLAVILVLPLLLLAEEIAILKSADISAYNEAIQGFKSRLPPSTHITLEYDLQGDMAKGRDLARRIRASNATLVLAVGLKAALAAKLEILDIPVIFCLVLDPDKYGLPSGNMVGLSLDVPLTEQIRLLKTLLPQVRTIGVLFDPQKTAGMVKQLNEEGKRLDIAIRSKEVKSDNDLPISLNALLSDIDALLLIPDSTILTEHSLDFLISRALEENVPVVGFSAGLVKSGALAATFLQYDEIGQQAANLFLDIVRNSQSKSNRLGTLVMPKKFRWSLNQKTAEYFGIPLSQQILGQFDERF